MSTSTLLDLSDLITLSDNRSFRLGRSHVVDQERVPCIGRTETPRGGRHPTLGIADISDAGSREDVVIIQATECPLGERDMAVQEQDILAVTLVRGRIANNGAFDIASALGRVRNEAGKSPRLGTEPRAVQPRVPF